VLVVALPQDVPLVRHHILQRLLFLGLIFRRSFFFDIIKSLQCCFVYWLEVFVGPWIVRHDSFVLFAATADSVHQIFIVFFGCFYSCSILWTKPVFLWHLNLLSLCNFLELVYVDLTKIDRLIPSRTSYGGRNSFLAKWWLSPIFSHINWRCGNFCLSVLNPTASCQRLNEWIVCFCTVLFNALELILKPQIFFF